MNPSTRHIVLLLALQLCTMGVYTQTQWLDSVKKIAATQKPDTNKVWTFISLSNSYQLYYPDSSFFYAQRALTLAEKLNFEPGIFWSEVASNGSLTLLGNYPRQLESCFKAFALAQKINTPRTIAMSNGMLSECYFNLGDYAMSLQYWREVMKIAERSFPDEGLCLWSGLTRIFNGMGQSDSALFYAKKCYETVKQNKDQESYNSRLQTSGMSVVLGNAFTGKGRYDSALCYYHQGISLSIVVSAEIFLIDGYNGIAAVYKAMGKTDSATWYAKKILTEKISKTYPAGLLKAANMLASIYESKKKADSTLKYERIATRLKDSLFNREKIITIQNLTYREQEKQKEIASSQQELKTRFKLYLLAAGLIALLVIAGIMFRNNRHKQMQNIRNSIADDLHDEIGSTLSSISIMSELARQKSPEASHLLSSIGENTLSIQENMSDIVWAINPKNDHFENVLQRMNQFAAEILEAKNIELDFSGDASLSCSRLTMGQRKNFYLFFKEAINNAAKYSGAKKRCVCITQKDHQVKMNICDNGNGFDPARVLNGNGMSTLKKRAAELNARFSITSHLKQGTAVQLTFKIT